MKYNRLGTSDLEVSEIGLGCMSFSAAHEREAHFMIDYALDQGVNFLDTADLYEHGENERLIGRAIKGKRSQVVLATKGGNQWNEDGQGWSWNPSKAYLKEAAKESLRRLQTDYIDLYQLHGGTTEDPWDETLEAFEELKKEGYIRYYGISSIRPNVIREIAKRNQMVSVMSQYSMLDRRPEEETLALLAENSMSLIARGPLAKGLLTAYWPDKIKEEGYLDYKQEELRKVLRELNALSNEAYSLSHLALRYVLYQPAVATVIPGVSKLAQLEELLGCQHTPRLDDGLFQAVQAITQQQVYTSHR